jgi:hypothetical protein
VADLPTATALTAVTALADVLRVAGGAVCYATVHESGRGRIVVLRGNEGLGSAEFVLREGTWLRVERGERRATCGAEGVDGDGRDVE